MKTAASNLHADQVGLLMDTALGRTASDLAVINARVFNVFTNELLNDLASRKAPLQQAGPGTHRTLLWQVFMTRTWQRLSTVFVKTEGALQRLKTKELWLNCRYLFSG